MHIVIAQYFLHLFFTDGNPLEASPVFLGEEETPAPNPTFMKSMDDDEMEEEAWEAVLDQTQGGNLRKKLNIEVEREREKEKEEMRDEFDSPVKVGLKEDVQQEADFSSAFNIFLSAGSVPIVPYDISTSKSEESEVDKENSAPSADHISIHLFSSQESVKEDEHNRTMVTDEPSRSLEAEDSFIVVDDDQEVTFKDTSVPNIIANVQIPAPGLPAHYLPESPFKSIPETQHHVIAETQPVIVEVIPETQPQSIPETQQEEQELTASQMEEIQDFQKNPYEEDINEPQILDELWKDLHLHLLQHNRKIVHVYGDGFCFLNSVEEAVCNDHQMCISVETMAHMITGELADNLHIYAEGYVGEPESLIAEAITFFDSKDYKHDVVDIIAAAASKALHVGIYIYQENQGNIQLLKQFETRLDKVIYLVYSVTNLSGTEDSRHYDAAINLFTHRKTYIPCI